MLSYYFRGYSLVIPDARLQKLKDRRSDMITLNDLQTPKNCILDLQNK